MSLVIIVSLIASDWQFRRWQLAMPKFLMGSQEFVTWCRQKNISRLPKLLHELLDLSIGVLVIQRIALVIR